MKTPITTFFHKPIRIGIALLAAIVAFAMPAAAQHGLSLSSNADFSTNDRLFADGETIYIKVEPRAEFDAMAITESSFDLEPVRDGEGFEGTLSIQDDGSFTGSVEVAALEGEGPAWHLRVKIEDEFDHEYEARTAIVIRSESDHPHVFRISGTVEAASESEISVAGHAISVTSDTELHARTDIEIADLSGHDVVVIVQQEADETLTALQIFVQGDEEQDGVISFRGRIQSVGDASIVVRGVEIGVNEQTVIESGSGEPLLFSDLEARMAVHVEAHRTDEGWVATSIVVRIRDRGDDEEDDEEEVEGTIEVVGDGFIEVAGMQFEINDETEFDGVDGLAGLEVGMEVEVEFVTTEAGTHVATEIKVEDEDDDEDEDRSEIEVEGLITAVGDGTITVEGIEFQVTEETEIKGGGDAILTFADLSTGLLVEVEGVVEGGINIAEKIDVEVAEQTRVVLRGEITALGDLTATIDETEFHVTESTEIRGEHGADLTFEDLEVGLFAHAHLVEGDDGALTALRLKVKRPFEDDDVEITGRIEAVSSTEITVRGHTFAITEDTEIENSDGDAIAAADLEVGVLAHVEGEMTDGEALVATEIKVRTRLHSEGRFAGLVTAVGDALLEVNGVAFDVTVDTIIENATALADIAVGTRVKLRYRQLGDGTRVALRIEVKSGVDTETELSGAIDEIDGDVLVVAGVTVTVTAATSIEDEEGNPATTADLAVGQIVEVEGTTVAGGILASKIKIEDDVVISGAVSAPTQTSIELAGVTIEIDGETLIVGRDNAQLSVHDLQAGFYVEVIAGASAAAGKSGSSLTAERVLLINDSATATSSESSDVPVSFTLDQNYPNPFNPATNITFELDATSAGHVTLTIYNVLGQQVATLVDGALGAGTYTYQWNGRDDAGRPVASGIYLYQLRVGEQTATKPMTLMK